MGLTEQGRAQRCTKAFADRYAGEQAQVLGLQTHQHLAFEIAGKGTRIAHLNTVKTPALLGFEVNREQLQASHPAIGQLV
ncbi:hypothetical protein D9M71_705560 [compost metagenome]